MLIDASKTKLVEKVTLRKFNGDQSDPENCTEVIVTIDGKIVEHWRKLIVVKGDKTTSKWLEERDERLLESTNDWTRTEREARDEAFRVGDAVARSHYG